MRNRQEFEERVYELYRLKKQKRINNMKKFTVVGAGLVAAACIIFVFMHFNDKKIEPSPEYGAPTDVETATEGVAESFTEVLGETTGANVDSIINGIPDDGDVIMPMVVMVKLQPSETEVELNNTNGRKLYNLIMYCEADYTVEFDGPDGIYYELKLSDETVIVYNDGFIKTNEGWGQILNGEAAEIEEMLATICE